MCTPVAKWAGQRQPGDALDTAAQSLHKDRSIGTKTRLFRTDVAVVIVAGVEVRGLEQLQIGETPHLIGHSAEDVVVVHGRVGGDDAIQFGKHDQAVGRQQRVGKCRVRAAGGTNDFTGVIDFDQAAARAHLSFAGAVMGVLEGGEHVPVGQTQVGVRVHIASHVGKRGDDLGMQRVAHVEDEGAAGIMIVGKEHAAGGHYVFRVMDEFGLLVGHDRRHQLSVGGRSRIGIDDSEKVVALVGNITGPGEEVVARYRLALLLRLNRKTEAAENQ